MKFRSYPLIILLFAFLHSSGQKPPSKFGKVSMEEMQPTICPIDSNAHAYFVFDYGHSYFQYATTTVREGEASSGGKGFELFFKRHYRIKILDNNAFDWGNVEIPLYHDNEGSREKILLFRAITYVIEGKNIEKTKVKEKDLIVEERSEHWDVAKCALPNVRPGAFIEVEYTVKSPFLFNLQDWNFQHTIPVLHSEYYAVIPEYFDYHKAQWGYYPVSIETKTKKNTVTITYYERDKYAASTKVGSAKTKSTQTTEFLENIYHFQAENVPAFPIEKYLTTPTNYLTKVEFELAKTKFPGSNEKHYTQSWDDINNCLLRSEGFGVQLRRERFLKDEVEKLKASYSDTMELMEAAFNKTKNNFIWNGQYTKYVTSNLREAYKTGSGNCADINLSLVVLLRELGFEAYPVLLSTRGNGIIHPSHPSISSFNYVIAVAKIGDKSYLMDATEPYSEINLLPIRCLNVEGWIVDENNAQWIDLQTGNYGKSANYKLNLDDEGNFSGTMDYSFSRYAAYKECLKAKQATDNNTFLAEKFDDKSGLTITEKSITGIDTLYQKVKEHLELEISGQLKNAGEIYYFEPLFFESMEENPFRIEDREYPVEFEYPFTEMQSVSIQIPESFVVEELPKPMVVNLDDKSAKFTYSISQFGNTIQITSIFSVKKVIYMPEQYPFLKQLIDMIVSKHKDQIILKKI